MLLHGRTFRHVFRRARSLLAVALLSTNFLVSFGAAAAGTPAHSWHIVAPLPTPRSNVAAAVGLDGTIYAFGGVMDHPSESPSAILRDVEAYNPAINRWSPRAPLPARAFGASAATAPDGIIYLFGGVDGVNAAAAQTVRAYNPVTNTWTVRSSLPVPVVGAITVRGTIYLLAWQRMGGVPAIEIGVYDPRHNSWGMRAALPTRQQSPAVAAGRGGWIYLIGGQTAKGYPLKTVEAYNPVANTWTSRASLPAPREWLTATAGADGLIYAIGGQGSGYHGGRTVVAYDPRSNRWMPFPSMQMDVAFSTAVAGRNGHIYVIGGSGDASRLKTVETYSP